jgi:predicted nucleotidyltransferase
MSTKVLPISQSEALAIAERCAALLKTRFGAKRVIVFGSAVGQAPWHAGSDLDLAVEGIRPEEFFAAWAAVDHLVPPGLQVDLVDLETAYPEMRARILGEVEMSDDPVLALKSLVADELKALERVAAQMKEDAAEAHTPPTRVEMNSMGRLIHDFYTGVENIFQRIAVQFDGGVPKTAFWHKDLLNQMNEPREGTRPAVIDDRLWALLEDYLKFRHFFRNAYAVPLEWDRLQLHVTRMDETLAMLQIQLKQFFAALRPDETAN